MSEGVLGKYVRHPKTSLFSGISGKYLPNPFRLDIPLFNVEEAFSGNSDVAETEALEFFRRNVEEIRGIDEDGRDVILNFLFEGGVLARAVAVGQSVGSHVFQNLVGLAVGVERDVEAGVISLG